jgi:hypothetical protein
MQARLHCGAADVALPAQLQDSPRRWQMHCVGPLWTFECGNRNRLMGASERDFHRKGEDHL